MIQLHLPITLLWTLSPSPIPFSENFSFHMGETQEVQHSHETSFTIHMGESQEVQLSKIGKSSSSIFNTKRFNYVKRDKLGAECLLKRSFTGVASYFLTYSQKLWWNRIRYLFIYAEHRHVPVLCHFYAYNEKILVLISMVLGCKLLN